MAQFSEADLAAARAQQAAIEATPETLDDPKLEAVASILQVWLNMDDARTIRWEVLLTPESALDVLIEARRQTGADELAAALREVAGESWLDDDTMEHVPGIKRARAALAAYERIAG